mmetsp:Transcript_16245/g.13854  ORF Transcript_16245/g.13854 Transcript_16245/m.13854 type:complete len:150 (+) Transcript_16245:1902-2351(+)
MKLCLWPCDDYEVIFSNGECGSWECPEGFDVKKIGDYQMCVNSCEDDQFLFLYDVGTKCIDDCPAPFEIVERDNFRYCENPCVEDDMIISSNGECLDDCPEPLVEKMILENRVCSSPCEDEESTLMFNGKCLDEDYCPASYPTREIGPF